MQCPNCGKTGFVNISGKRFCSNCGAKLPASGPATMSDIKSASGTLDLRAKSESSEAPGPNRPIANPAGQLHGMQVSGPAVLDLRTNTAKPVEATTTAASQPVATDLSSTTPPLEPALEPD